MDQNPPQYGERVEALPTSLPTPEISHFEEPESHTNEYDVELAKIMLHRTKVRSLTTISIFALIMTPFILAVISKGFIQ